ncbi:hypothetical protein GIB67_039576 [Kingdonia uniflora]|uniref:Rubisco accumulation factor 1.1, chloroplastic n=1 Tax=Kingdonia uniflora TaxID=39325 RepID=A0A7J7P760_9MAGN|nr:hypothetical protein GIB67_039576 [Kingdonia uniflora]
MLSLNTSKPLSSLQHQHQHQHQHTFPLNLRTTKLHHHHSFKPISATIIPSSSSPASSNPQLYQPFRPPPTPLPSRFLSLDQDGRLEVLRDRLGIWYEYAPLIPSLVQQGFSPSTIEEATGISCIEQNRLIVAAQVRDSLLHSNLDDDTLSFFDNNGAEILYEIRLLSVDQRSATARFIVERSFDGREVQELARAIKDYPRRRGDDGWDCFDYVVPGDCLAFMYFRHSGEHRNPSEQRTSALKRALEVAVTDKAKQRVLDELEAKVGGVNKVDEVAIGIKVPVVRMQFGEVAEATSVVVLPVCKEEEGVKGVVDAPMKCTPTGEFGIVTAERGWNKWVVLPSWNPLAGLKQGGIAVAFRDARVLPWKVNKWQKEESILVVADRGKKDVVADDGFYLVSIPKQGDESEFKVERGLKLKELGVKECLGTVTLVVRPPKDDVDDQLSDEDWN